MAEQPKPYGIDDYITHFRGMDAPDALPGIARADVGDLRLRDLAELDETQLRDRLARLAGLVAVLLEQGEVEGDLLQLATRFHVGAHITVDAAAGGWLIGDRSTVYNHATGQWDVEYTAQQAADRTPYLLPRAAALAVARRLDEQRRR